MKSLLYALTALAVFGLAFWAYRENYATQQVLKETRGLQREIGAAQERLSVLRAEWAYLNRPDRLMELAELNFERLGLLPLRPDQFGRVDEVSYPVQPALLITEGVDVSGLNAQSGEEPGQ
ncbi:cell division protein FtsL [Phaeobacter sp. 11ANDIMAR09]|uniref:cell division protein FtsL n=1 Tax=Phaeobacter sp. 11ANDIMAR09 TaxID=1225647 RepID=UPI0006C86201|nr:cell division protein FtsL [Phaeobacter sp. 11ANDIMAR09]KPD12826.1 cell division protein FtsL [Phaeobacter sp. 11ANDIMAR09]OIQ34469.1 MAG: cell division protein FtsL [Roseobacter sp. MedPE-SWchi]